MFVNKLVIGTANFNKKYGLLPTVVKYGESKKIINFCKRKNIIHFDTSRSYKNSEKLLGKTLNSKAKIITKLPPIKLYNKLNKTEAWIKNHINISLKQLKRKKIYALILHKPDILLGYKGKEIYKILINLKKKNIIKKIGVSIYDYNLLKNILYRFKIDIAQVPFNVFDQRLIHENFSKYKKLEIHCRSIFLQGLLLKDSKNLPKKFNSLKAKWKKWDNWINVKKINKTEACLNFVLKYKNIYDKIVVGIENKDQLEKIYNFKERGKILDFSGFDNKKKQVIKKNFLRR